MQLHMKKFTMSIKMTFISLSGMPVCGGGRVGGRKKTMAMKQTTNQSVASCPSACLLYVFK